MAKAEIKGVTLDELRHMSGKEGLVLQGCGGDLQEWVDGVNELLTEAGILLEGSRFKEASTFQYEGRTNLLFPLDGAKLDVGRLAMWRLQTHSTLGSTWLSDYVPNRLGGFIYTQETQKPPCPLIGADGNIFNLIGLATRTLREHGLEDQAREMRVRIMDSGDYNRALTILGEYVEITSAEEPEQELGGMQFG
ncbi:hypothetical protein [Pseudoflavonifractor phocaeensis]|uniref:hypothetical protein n=1 Tax=Pseudoflavonifractor phocaeensis TaxID=1870988 RepID=UPI00210DA0FD|nr:hypothetical protein [Pseudoflavonifractor phocaeensis]MCQ4863557.1 hypothetical protein [Pseudoflavonifractor phocaeensis]